MSPFPLRMNASLCVLVSFVALINLSASFTASSLHCAVRREINPCTCRHRDSATGSIAVVCEKMASFGQVVDALQDRFGNHSIALKIAVSNLDDLASKSFQELGMRIIHLKLVRNNLSILHEDVFSGLLNVADFSLSDNVLPQVPSHILRRMPSVATLDLSRNKIKHLSAEDLKGMPDLRTLLLADNNMTHIHENSFPPTLKQLHIGFNNLTSLNNSVRGLTDLTWLFINNNRLTSLEGQLGPLSKLTLLLLHNNQLESLPSDIQYLSNVDALYARDNKITHLNGLVSGLSKLRRLDLESNQIKMIRTDEFQYLNDLEELMLRHNNIVSINASLSGLFKLNYLDISHNELPEFLLQDIRGLKRLRILNLSHNKIKRLGSRNEGKNLVEGETNIFELMLQHNEIETLDGALMGIHGLSRLNLSHNRLKEIAPDDFIGLDALKLLDISHNQLSTLEETSKTFLPALEELMVSHNSLTALEKDFHGLPVLCMADLAHNNIKAINIQLAIRSQCKIHGLNSTLRIYLQGNPVLCEKSIRIVIEAMEATNNTKIHAGETMCQEESLTTTVAPTTTTSEPTTLRVTTTATTTTTESTTPPTTTPSETLTANTPEEVTETITLELPQPVETNNQIPVQDKTAEEKLPPNVEEKIIIEEKIIPVFNAAEARLSQNTNTVPEEMIAEKENIEVKLAGDDAKDDSKVIEDKTPNRIPTGEPVADTHTRPVDSKRATIAKLSPLLTALGPDNVAYVVENTTEMDLESISVIKN